MCQQIGCNITNLYAVRRNIRFREPFNKNTLMKNLKINFLI